MHIHIHNTEGREVFSICQGHFRLHGLHCVVVFVFLTSPTNYKAG